MILFPSGAHDDTVDACLDMMEMAMEGGGTTHVSRIANEVHSVRDLYR